MSSQADLLRQLEGKLRRQEAGILATREAIAFLKGIPESPRKPQTG